MGGGGRSLSTEIEREIRPEQEELREAAEATRCWRWGGRP